MSQRCCDCLDDLKQSEIITCTFCQHPYCQQCTTQLYDDSEPLGEYICFNCAEKISDGVLEVSQ